MTLRGLIEKVLEVQDRYISSCIPIKYEGKDVDIDLVPAGNFKDGYEVNLIIKQ